MSFQLPSLEQPPDRNEAYLATLADDLLSLDDVGVLEAEVLAWAKAEHNRIVVRGGQPQSPKAVELPEEPLYTLDPIEGWEYNGYRYTQAQARKWVSEELHKCLGLHYFATHYASTRHEHLDEVDEEKAPGPELIPDWPFVRAVFDAFDPPRDVIVEKSRDMMLSWLSMATACHDLLFRVNRAVMTMSRIEDLVDDGGESSTVDSLHGKIRFIYMRLPAFLRETVTMTFKYLSIRCSETESHIKGFSATPNAGRGPKWKRAILDEFA